MATRRSVLAGGAATGLTAALPYRALADERMLSPAAMRADIALLRRAYEALHPGLYRYATPARSAAQFDALAAAVARPLSPGDFYLALSRRLALVKCGHSYANFFNQTKDVKAALFDAHGRLPLHFLWMGERMIVTADPHGTGIIPGSEVRTIDGRPAAGVLAGLMSVARADGHNDAKRRRLMSVQGGERYDSFDIFYARLFGTFDRFVLDVAAPDGRVRRATLPAISLAARQRDTGPAAAADPNPWTIERRGRAAVLTMPSWALYDSRWDWRGWLDGQMDALIADRVPALIVDLRSNEGGMDCGDAILARMVERPIVADTARRLVRYRTLPADLRPYCDTWDRAFDTLGEGAPRYDDRYYELRGGERDATVIAPAGKRYSGRLIVLTSAENSSATFGFAQTVRRERLGTLVGDTTGGNLRGINGGCFYFFRLPETGMEADLPLIGTFPRVAQPDAGIEPDIRVVSTAADIATGRDAVMERALMLA